MTITRREFIAVAAATIATLAGEDEYDGEPPTPSE